MSALDGLYQQIIVDHSRNPRHFGPLPAANRRAVGDNPVCGDHIEVALVLDPSARITAAAFQGAGCAIATASASMMTAAVLGRTPDEARALAERLERIVTGEAPDADAGDLAALSGVARFPVRIKCARLPWRALQAALSDGTTTVSTET